LLTTSAVIGGVRCNRLRRRGLCGICGAGVPFAIRCLQLRKCLPLGRGGSGVSFGQDGNRRLWVDLRQRWTPVPGNPKDNCSYRDESKQK
jgi:hypothetical protein